MVKSSIVPIPPSLVGLPVITPEPWLQVDDDPHKLLEGPSFDREGNLFITSIFDGRVLKITPDKKVAIIFDDRLFVPMVPLFTKD
ncbi:unnamed protein product, partial [marine sediment metagenome]